MLTSSRSFTKHNAVSQLTVGRRSAEVTLAPAQAHGGYWDGCRPSVAYCKAEHAPTPGFWIGLLPMPPGRSEAQLELVVGDRVLQGTARWQPKPAPKPKRVRRRAGR
jgi:hypothetical protein